MTQKKTLENGVIKINDVSFLEFHIELLGLNIIDKRNGAKVPRFILFWKGLSVSQIKRRYSLVDRER